MEQGIEICGTHTGGGWGSTPEEDDAHIYYAVGRLSGSDLTIDGVHRCDGRPGLFWVIVDSRGPWGLDFPFALPAWTYEKFSHRDWPDLLEFADVFDHARVRDYIRAAELDDLEEECRQPGGVCRVTDAEAGALSPIKRYRPDRLRTTHEGLRLLSRLRGHGASVYPFDDPGRARQRLYEVYPANTYARLGLGDAPGPGTLLRPSTPGKGAPWTCPCAGRPCPWGTRWIPWSRARRWPTRSGRPTWTRAGTRCRPARRGRSGRSA